MNKNARAYKIYEAATEVLPEEHDINTDLLFAIAAMIDYSTKKPAAKKKPKLLYNEHDVISATTIELKPTRYGVLNRQLHTLKLQPDDLEVFSAWFTQSMLPWLNSKDIDFTYSMLCRKYPEWLERARKYSSSANTSSEAWR